MKALVLAAGLGTRMRTLTAEVPKPMLPVYHRPLLEHTLALLREHGVRQVAINVHHRPEVIWRYFGNGRHVGLDIEYSFESELLGTAGAAKRLQRFLDEPFVVIYGDVLTDINLTALAAWHAARDAQLTLALYRVEDPTRAGIVNVDAVGRVTRFVEKPRASEVFSDLASAGVLVSEPSVLQSLPADRPLDFGADVLPRMLADGDRVCGRLADAYVLDIGSPARYRQAQLDAAEGRIRMYTLGRMSSATVSADETVKQC
jgi:NDP-sugar pyrophosphorylase family protein